MAKAIEIVDVGSRAEWRAWLEEHHQQRDSINLVMYRQSDGERYIPYEELVEEALCFGWIDSTRRRLDDDRTVLLMAPRKRGSGWARTNKERVERLIQQGLMTPAGLVVIEAARQDGSWSRYDAAEALAIPGDLATGLATDPDAEANFASFPPSTRKAIIQWVLDARRPDTRAKRIAEIVEKASRNERAR